LRDRPAAPAPRGLRPALDPWPAGKPLVRLFHRDRGPLGFNPSSVSARFRPVHDRDGAVVPTAYAAADRETAFAESLLRGADFLARDERPRLYRKEVEGIEMVTLSPRRELPLARLHGQGLTRLRVLRSELIDVGPTDYPYTADWAQAIYDCPAKVAGIAWTSRQNDSERAVMLWQGPVDPAADLEQADDPVPLDREPGIDLVREACVDAGFDFEG
jgi:RES domain